MFGDPDPILIFIRTYVEANAIPPTFREIAQGCSLSLAATSYRIHSLVKEGQLALEPRQARGVRLV